MVWWACPRQVWEELPRRTWQSHSSFPQPTVFEELCQFAQCFYSGGLVLPAYWELMPLLRQGLVKGVFLTKASSPWAGNKSQSIQVSLCLPNQRDLDTWYEAVFALPLAWPDITDIDPHYLKKTSAHQLLSIRMQMGVSHMWGDLSPQWHLLNITCGMPRLVTIQGGLRNCLSLIGRVGRVKMSMTLSCPGPHLIGRHGRRGNIPRKR